MPQHRNLYKGLIRYPRDEAILSRRGDVVHDDITVGGVLAQALGFPPSEYTLKQEQNHNQTDRPQRGSVGPCFCGSSM